MPHFDRRAILAAGALAPFAPPASAQQYPERLIKIVSPAPPGGSTDIMSRLLQPGMQEFLKQNVIVESRGGAGGYIGSDAVAKSPADGYTVLLGGAFTANTALLKKKPAYDPRKDLVPLAIVASVPNILVAGPRLKQNDLASLVAEAKANPEKINVGSNGVGTTLHLSAELLKARTGIKLTHVPFRGWSDCMVAVVNGEIEIMFDNLNTALPNIKDGKLRAIALADAKRHPTLPDTPTLGELGVKDAEVTSWFGIMVPAGMPAPVAEKLAQSLSASAQSADFKRLVAAQGMDAIYMGPAEAGKYWLAEIDKWEAIINSAGVEKQD